MTRQIPEPLTYFKINNTRDYVLRTYVPDPINYEITTVSGNDYKTYYFVSFKYKHIVNVGGFLIDSDNNNISADQLSNTCLIDGRLYDNTYYRPYYINTETYNNRPKFSLYFTNEKKFTIDVKETYHQLNSGERYYYYYYPSGGLSPKTVEDDGAELHANGFVVTDTGIYLADTESITQYRPNSETLVCLCLQYGETVDIPPPANAETPSET